MHSYDDDEHKTQQHSRETNPQQSEESSEHRAKVDSTDIDSFDDNAIVRELIKLYSLIIQRSFDPSS
jgi:hypothetical protein